jgi:hypothetical protein
MMTMKQDPDETSHWIKEYRINAARMRERANAVRKPEDREQFEQIARELDHWADTAERLLGSSSTV